MAEARENEEKLRKVNDTLVKGLEANTINLSPLQDIKLVLEGEFTNQRIAELERELEQYRAGVNVSIDRRVREIVKGYAEMEEEERKSRLKLGDRSRVNIHYNLQEREAPCDHCPQLHAFLQERDRLIEELHNELQEVRADRDILAAKLPKMEALVENLKRENGLLQGELGRAEWERAEWEREGRKSYRREKENEMMREISSIVSGLSNRKQEERGKSRLLAGRDSSNLFSIKNGINRPSQNFF